MSAITALPKRDMAASTTGCCPPFDPTNWDQQTFEFHNKPFMKVSTRSLFHIPLNMSAVMKAALAKVEAATAASDDGLMLTEEVSPWHADHYIAVTKPVPGTRIAYLSGTYLTKVFEGPYQEMRHWHDQLIEYAKSRGRTPLKVYFSYTVCPACAKAYGKNYVIGFAQVA